MVFIKGWLGKHRADHDIAQQQVREVTEQVEEPDDTIPIASSSTQIDEPTPLQNQSINFDHESWPTRLIFVGDTDFDIVRLVYTNTFSNSPGRYAALSYCWRNNETLCLRESNIINYENFINVGPKSRTVLDAIHVTRKLGIRYLWIDALCIIQDCEDDKRRELPRMHEIYSKADIVIASAASWDASESFFVEQNPWAMTPCLLGSRGTVENRAATKFQFGAIYALPSEKYARNASDHVKYSRLQTRAWVFQEERLARRIVWFGNSQVHLHCRDCNETIHQVMLPNALARKTESAPNTVHPDIALFIYRLLGRSAMSSSHVQRALSLITRWTRRPITESSVRPTAEGYPGLTVENFEDTWWQQVFHYSTRNLTKSEEKLPAINGFARQLHKATHTYILDSDEADISFQSEYFAGHWNRENLCMSLLWYVQGGKTGRPKARAPSWSWAAVDGAVANNSLLGDSSSASCRIQIGSIESTSVHLSGYLNTAKWDKIDNRKSFYIGHGNSDVDPIMYKEHLQWFDPLSEVATAGPEAFGLMTEGGEHLGILIPDAEDNELTLGEPIYCLGIFVQPTDEDGKEDFNTPWVTRGLALKKVGDESEWIFRRIGYIELENDLGGLSFPQLGNGLRVRRYPAPDLDKYGFFNVSKSEIVIQ